ncbi:MAG: hypothetical protein M1827_004473 [Pycnora praestabilis]|nr:MAG: hypothetical protein M1827_004473 [Pycnora praestabilis]
MAFSVQGRWNSPRIVIGVIGLATFITLFTFRSALQERAGFKLPYAELPSQPRPLPPKQIEYPEDLLNETSPAWPATPATPVLTSSSAGECDTAVFPQSNDVLVVIKTGATEAYNKLPVHFLTTLRCTRNYLIFSDMEQDMGGYHIYDSLDEVTEEFKASHDDFKLYRKLQEYRAANQDTQQMGGEGAWNLDKYKFLHMLEKTWRMRPDAKWYVFLEADSYLVWSNLLRWLATMDPTDPLYIGSPSYLGDIEFTHGGSGWIISQEAMKRAIGNNPGIGSEYEDDVSGVCCGDAMMAKAILDKGGIHVTKRWPMINGEKPTTVPYDDRHWCSPVITMHHLSPEEVSRVWNCEYQRNNTEVTSLKSSPILKATPSDTIIVQDVLLWKDIFDHFAQAEIRDQRENWNNLAGDLTYKSREADQGQTYTDNSWDALPELDKNAFTSYENCSAACHAKDECYQWMYQDRTCHMGTKITLGGRKVSEGTNQYISGWNMEKISQFRQNLEPCKPNWIT